MIKFYYNTGPNPMKVALFLEESELDYEAIPLDTRKGEQHNDDYKKLAKAVLKAINDKKESQKRLNLAYRSLSRFDEKVNCKKYLSILRQFIYE